LLRPSYTDLLEILNKDADKDNIISSRYTIVIAAAKRARQIIEAGYMNEEGAKVNKPVSFAVDELYNGKIKIIKNGENKIKKNTEDSVFIEYDAVEDVVDFDLDMFKDTDEDN